MKYAALSDKGLVRPNNEDAFLATEAAIGVADGMGGHEGGELASQIALEEASKAITSMERRPKATLAKIFANANSAVLRMARESQQTGMGTTLTIAVLKKQRIWIGHIGDSRAYLLRGGNLEQLTEDHSLVGDLVRSGGLSQDEARTHPKRHVITKAVGTQKLIKPDIFSLAFEDGDRLLICTDGLTNHVEPDSLSKLAAGGSPESACERLVEAAKERGGSDNITVVIGDINGASESKPDRSSTDRRTVLSRLFGKNGVN